MEFRFTAMPGVAFRGDGDTCGAVIGALMAIGLIHGRETPEDAEGSQSTFGPAVRFCKKFGKELGSCMC